MEKKNKPLLSRLLLTLISLAAFILLFFLLIESNSDLAKIFSFENISNNFYEFIPRLIVLVLLYFIFKLLYIFIIEFFVSRFQGLLISHTRFSSLEKLFRFIWWSLYGIIAISTLISDIGTLVASAGLIGLGLTFALQKPILNLVGWLTIIIKEIYIEGDRIKVGNVVGDVKEIQLMNTVIRSVLENSNVRSHKIVTIPNEMVLTGEVENYTKESNYIREELKISITYESNFKKAMEILDKTVTDLISNNLKSYIKVKKTEQKEINQLLKELLGKGEHLTKERANLDKEKSVLKREIEELKTLEEEFLPKIRMEMADSSLVLIAQFLTPFYEVKKNRTAVNISFLEAIEKENDIEIAYPHLELIYNKEKNGDK